MMEILRGKAWIFGDDLDVDHELISHEELRRLPPEKRNLKGYGELCMTVVDPDFPKKVNKGDFVVAGTNLGCGHDHATWVLGMKGCGIAAVISESLHEWARRNCILMGLPAIQYSGIKQKVKQGDELEIDFPKGRLTNLTTGETLRFEPLPKFLLDIQEAGNLETYLKNKISSGKLDTFLE